MIDLGDKLEVVVLYNGTDIVVAKGPDGKLYEVRPQPEFKGEIK